jgi:hypothetical protein
MGRFQRVEIEIIVDEHAAPGRRHADGLPPEIHFIDDLCEETGHDAVAAPRTIVEVGIFEEPGPGIDLLHCFLPLTDW